MHDLLEKCINGDRLSQEILYRKYFDFMTRICRRYVSNDSDAVYLMNQAFYKILSNLSSFRKEDNFESWVNRITINTAIDNTRRVKSRKNIESNYELTYDRISLNTAESDTGVEDIMKMIQKLPDTSRTVFNLSIIEGYPHKEISKKLNMSEESSRWHLNKARNLFKKIYERNI
jgi:RNA polymerase sigma-70 factor (ECF subfamily)